MATMTIRLPDEKHRRLQRLAKSRGLSLNRLVDELSSVALAQFDTELRFRLLAKQGDPAKGLKLLDKLDKAFKLKPPKSEEQTTDERE
jgi:hypothetical protein